MSLRTLLRSHCIILLLCLAWAVQCSTQSEEEDLNDYWQNVTADNFLSTLIRFIEAQLFPATEFDPLPALGWLAPPGEPTYKVHRCKRVNVANCTHGEYLARLRCSAPLSEHCCNLTFSLQLSAAYVCTVGNPESPKEFQGAYFQEAIPYDEVRKAV